MEGPSMFDSSQASGGGTDSSTSVNTKAPSTPFLKYRSFEWGDDQVNIRQILHQHVWWLDQFYRSGMSGLVFPPQVTPWDITENDWRALLATGVSTTRDQ
jgi:hypothetical protein